MFKDKMLNRKDRLASLQVKLAGNNHNTKSYADSRFWKLETNDGIGSAVIRFLPECDGSDEVFVQYYRHEFKGSFGWMIDNCPTTIKGQCPVCERNREIWESGDEDTPKKRKRKEKFVSNIMVVDDPQHPENNGKVFLFLYGKSIFDMIKDASSPTSEFPDEPLPDPVDVFDFIEGANFNLRMSMKGSIPTYEKSSFQSPSRLSVGGREMSDDEMEKLWKSQYNLEEFNSPEFFKPYDALKTRFEKVTGETVPAQTSYSKPEQYSKLEQYSKPETSSEFLTKTEPVSSTPSNVSNAVGDDLSFFEKLAAQP